MGHDETRRNTFRHLIHIRGSRHNRSSWVHFLFVTWCINAASLFFFTTVVIAGIRCHVMVAKLRVMVHYLQPDPGKWSIHIIHWILCWGLLLAVVLPWIPYKHIDAEDNISRRPGGFAGLVENGKISANVSLRIWVILFVDVIMRMCVCGLSVYCV